MTSQDNVSPTDGRPDPVRLDPGDRRRVGLLLLTIWIIALCGISYELVIGTLSSYLLGNSVWEFSLTIGLFMSSMGLGSYLSRYIDSRLPDRFVLVEILVGLAGGSASMVLFTSFVYTDGFRLVMVSEIAIIGGLVGLELPLLTRIVNRYTSLKLALANVFAWDYVGALAGSLLFPLVLLPWLGLVVGSALLGLLNVLVALLNVRLFEDDLAHPRRLAGAALAVAGVLVTTLVAGGWVTRYMEGRLYRDEVVLSVQTKYQKLVFTKFKDDLRLFIDGNLQFAAVDEYRYHEALVHPLLANLRSRERILVLGGGDGLAVREILEYPDVEEVVLVDLDPEMTRLAREFEPLRRLNRGSLDDPRVEVVNQDAFEFLSDGAELFDGIIIDLPDPNNEALAKLYSVEFYRLVRRRLSRDGLAITQSTSPFDASMAFWCINESLREAFEGPQGRVKVWPMHLHVPSFGEWGFQLAGRLPDDPSKLGFTDVQTRYLTPETQACLFSFPKDLQPPRVEPSHLGNPRVLYFYLAGWRGEG